MANRRTLTSFVRGYVAPWARYALRTVWIWFASLSAFAHASFLGATLTLGWIAATGHAAPNTPKILRFGETTLTISNVATMGTLESIAWVGLVLVGCFVSSILIRGDSHSLAHKGERSGWVGGRVGHTIVRHGLECLVWMGFVVTAWGLATWAGVMTAAVLVVALPLLGFFTSGFAFFFTSVIAALFFKGFGGFAGLAAIPVSTPSLPLFLAVAWLIFTAADPKDRFEHWWPVRRDLVGPMLSMVWRRMETSTFDRAVDDALLDARRLWQARGVVLETPTRVVVHRQGTGVQIVGEAGALSSQPIAPFVAQALGRRIAGRLPPPGIPWTRTLPADSAHTRMAVAARALRTKAS